MQYTTILGKLIKLVVLLSVQHLKTCVSPDEFNFKLTDGEILFVSGPSGSGKSMLLRALADLDEHSGSIMLDDKKQSDWLPQQWRKTVAYCPADSAWWGEKVGDHFDQKPGAKLLTQLGLEEDVMNWQAARLSSGEKQRLGLLRVLSLQPQVLLLDEPTANLDDASALAVEAVLDTYRKQTGAILVWVSHSTAQQSRFDASRLVL